ncbi:MAG TPA: hypothetical protein VG387_13925 [Rhizomicrobium sp.]|jgi:hypothetical protein|nr:hypothetical protein [Rhizomicrobium sp.]
MSQSLSLTRINPITTTPRWSMVLGALLAVIAHVGLIAFIVYFSLNWRPLLQVAEDSPPSVPVDLVTIADKTNIAPTVQKTAPKPAEAPIPPPQPVPPTPTPAPRPDEDSEPAPVPSQPVLPKKEPLPKPMAKPQPAPETPPAPPKEAKKPKADDFSSLLNKLTTPAAAPRNARVAEKTVKGGGAMNAETADLVTALKSQIAQCWSPPTGAPHSERLIPTFRLSLNPDGSVAQPPQLSADSAAAAASDPFMRAAAEAARRAIMTCQPYKLPNDKYSAWRDISIDFDPRSMTE